MSSDALSFQIELMRVSFLPRIAMSMPHDSYINLLESERRDVHRQVVCVACLLLLLLLLPDFLAGKLFGKLSKKLEQLAFFFSQILSGLSQMYQK